MTDETINSIDLATFRLEAVKIAKQIADPYDVIETAGEILDFILGIEDPDEVCVDGDEQLNVFEDAYWDTGLDETVEELAIYDAHRRADKTCWDKRIEGFKAVKNACRAALDAHDALVKQEADAEAAEEAVKDAKVAGTYWTYDDAFVTRTPEVGAAAKVKAKQEKPDTGAECREAAADRLVQAVLDSMARSSFLVRFYDGEYEAAAHVEGFAPHGFTSVSSWSFG